MQVKHILPEYSHILHWNDILTSIYVPLFLSYFYYNNNLLLIGKFVNIYNIFILAFMEVIKYIVYIKYHKTVVHKHVKDFVKSLLAVFLFFGIMYIVTVLFGAAVFSKIEETFMFTLLITLLTALPICLHFSVETALNMFLSITSHEGTEIQNLFMLKLRLTLFGAWLGAIAIPLDWNRPWQNWPIPCSVGALAGYILANWITTYIQYQRGDKLTKKTGKYTL